MTPWPRREAEPSVVPAYGRSDAPDLEVRQLNPKIALVAIVLALAALVACEDEVSAPPPPAAPAQITTVSSYYKTTNSKGQQNGLPSNDVYAFLAVSNGEFWIGTAQGIARYPDQNSVTRGVDSYVNEINGLPNPKVRAMAEYNGKVYVATWGGGVGVYDVAGDTWSALQETTNGLRDNSVADIKVVPAEDRIYFATNNAVSIYNPTAGTFTSFTWLLDPLVSAAEVVDLSGVTYRWYGPRMDERIPADSVSSHGITVARSVGPVIKYTTVNSDLPEPNVNDIYFDDVRGTFFVAMSTKGISEVDFGASTWTTYDDSDGLPSGTVYGVTRADGKIWAATQNGLARLKGDGNWQGYRRGGGLQSDRVRVVYSPDGERLYVGFIDGGAARVDPASAK